MMSRNLLPPTAKITLLSLAWFACSAFCSTTLAQDATQEEVAKTEQETTDAPKVEPIGYFLGMSVGQNMRQSGFQLGDFDLDALRAGISDGLTGKDAVLSDEELRDAQKALEALLGKRRDEQMAELKSKGTEYLAKNKKEEGVTELESGLQYSVIKEGNGDSPEATDTVVVHYTGKLIDGTVFDSSVRRGEPANFRVNQVIQGWQEGLQKMKVGSKWNLFIPSDLAYGAQGRPGAIPPHQVLVFEVELLEIK